MSLSNLTTMSAFTDKAPLSPTYLNSKWSEVQQNVDQINSDGTTFGITRSGSTISFPIGSAAVLQSVDTGGQVLDIRAFGAVGDGATNNYTAIQRAINQASILGATVFIPRGNFVVASTLTIPASTATGVTIRGESRRDSIIQPTVSARTGILVGDGATNVSYVRLENFSVVAGTSGHSGCGISMKLPQQATLRQVNIEDFSGVDGMGLYLEGDAAGAAPHAYFGSFDQVLVSNVRRGLVLNNADENDFWHLSVGLASTTSSKVTAIQMLGGRNNRFCGTVLAGNTNTSSRISYVGLHLASPSAGDNYQNQFYGLVAEGFDAGIWIDSNATRSMIIGYNGSINSSHMSDGGAETVFIAPMHTAYQWPSGTSVLPSFAFSQDSRFGWYRSAASHMALSDGTLDLKSTKARVSIATVANTSGMGDGQLAVVMLASGLSLVYRSGGTAYVIGQSSQSAAA